MNCRHCYAELQLCFLDLGAAPPSNAYISRERLNSPEVYYPLRLMVCEQCWLVQTEDYAGRETFFDGDYAYFSSVSTSWVAHAERYVRTVAARFNLGPSSMVCEVAANDGYLLQFVQARGIPCFGIEPTRSTANAARAKGLMVVEEFFGVALADALVAQGRAADLIAANNVLAHVPDINDFTSGFVHLLKPTGVATFEFPHLLRMVQHGQFDTAYHEHYSYLSLSTVDRIFKANGLQVFDVEEIPTHGGSLRVFAQRSDVGFHAVTPAVNALIESERAAGMASAEFYEHFQHVAERIKNDLLAFLIQAHREGRKVVAYGAAAKGNTLLNFAGIRRDLINLVCDAAPSKQGKWLPGSRIPILSPEELLRCEPDYVLILPWNIAPEVIQQNARLVEKGVRFLTAVPELKII